MTEPTKPDKKPQRPVLPPPELIKEGVVPKPPKPETKK